MDISISSSNRSTSSKTNSFHSLNEDKETGDEAQTSAQGDERHDEGDDDGGEDHVNPEVQPQVSDNEPDYSIESIDSIESQIYSNQDYELDIGTGQHISDHSDESGQEAAHSMVPLSSPSIRGAAQKSICEEVRESDSSPAHPCVGQLSPAGR